MGYGVECWVDGERLFAMSLDSAEADLARDIAIEVLESRLHLKVLGETHGMGERVTRIVVAGNPDPEPGAG